MTTVAGGAEDSFPYSGRVLRLLAVLAVLVLTGAGCTSPGSSEPSRVPSRERLAWTPIPLGRSALPRTLTRSGDAVLVAGERSERGGYAPAAWVLRGGTASGLELRPRSAYAFTADVVSAAFAGDSVALLGRRSGGAHGIPRWTIWSGSVSGGVDELPQTFETFGGPASLGLVALATVAGQPLLLGNWEQDDDRPGPAFWRASGSRWARTPAGSGLRTTAREQHLATGLDVLGDRPVVLGHSVPLGSGHPRLVPAVWIGDRGGVRLGPAPVAQALDLSCGGERCLAAVRTPGSGVTVWQVRADGRAEALPVPAEARAATWAQVAVAADGGAAVAFGSAGTSELGRWDVDRRRWRLATAPEGEVRDLAVVGRQVLAIVGDGTAESAPRRLVHA